MPEKPKIAAAALVAGYEFPPFGYCLEPETVALYIKAVGGGGKRFGDGKFVPPTAIAAYALASLSQSMTLAEGTIHTQQALEFKRAVPLGETITCHAKVSRSLARGKFRFLNIDLDVRDSQGCPVMSGNAGFILP